MADTSSETETGNEVLETTTNFIAHYPWILIPVGLIFIWIGFGHLWDTKIRSMQASRGVPTASFNNILGRILKFVFKEDKYPAYLKDKNGEPTDALRYPKYGKYLVWRNIYFIGFAISLILAVLGNGGAPYILVATLLIIATRTSKVFSERHVVLIRMFEVAASELGYSREDNMNPWRWVQIKKWEKLTIPGEINVAFPNKYKSEEQRNRENFERHFNGTVTEDNTWIYHWKASKSMVSCSPVQHIPTFAQYPGSNSSWDKIPLGLGAEGELFWDVGQSPMSLITGTTGGGKMKSLRVLVETTEGQKRIGDLKVGDYVFDPEGKPTMVTHLHPIVTPEKAYELTLSNGEKITADPGHLWETETRVARLSRFNGVLKESKRSRQHWLEKTVRQRVVAAYEASESSETISISEVAAFIEKQATTGILYGIAKEIGVAEEVRPKNKLYHKARIMKQMQTLMYADSKQFMEAYNNRKIMGTPKHPLTRSQHDKIRQLITEVRESDTLTTESVIEYLDANKNTAKWVRENFDETLGTQNSVKDIYEKGESVKSSYPDKIFSIDSENINARQFATLVDVEFSDELRNLFLRLSKNCHTFRKKEEVELVRPERVTYQEGTPYFTYPKKMFLERILRHDDAPLNDQRNKRIYPEIRTTQEIFDTLKTEGATIYTNHSIRKAKALEMPEAMLPIHPYAMGAWLGDGGVHGGYICGIDHQVFDYIQEVGYLPKKSTLDKIHGGEHEKFRNVLFPSLSKLLRENNLLHTPDYSVRRDGSTKHIPAAYFSSSIEQRRELLRGLLDTDGTVKGNGAIQFYTSVPQLRDDAKRLIAGLGYIPNISEKNPTYEHKGETLTSETVAYTITFQADPADRLFGLGRKNSVHAERYNSNDTHSTADVHYIVDIQEVEPEPMRCLSVDSPSRLFLVSDSMVPTHNSTIQRNIIFHCIQHPDRWRFLGIDVKRVELKPYITYEPVVMGVATDTEDGVEILRYAKDEMEKRYQKMEDLGVNHFKDLPEHMHALMVMIDESYMFLATSGLKTDEGKEEDALKGEGSKLCGDIARLGRAAGVHLVMATQRPDATIIYGELKQNLACRIAAGKADTIASQMTLDNDNATRLPGDIKGRGYVQNFGDGEQFQGYFAPQKWIDKYLAGETEWLKMWAEEAKDLDSMPVDPNEFDMKKGKKKKEKKPKDKSERASFMEKFNNPDADGGEDGSDEKPKKKKKKGFSILDKMNSYNEKQSSDDDSPSAENSEDEDLHNPLDESSGTAEDNEPLISMENEQEDLTKIASEIKNAPVESNDPFADLDEPFSGISDSLDEQEDSNSSVSLFDDEEDDSDIFEKDAGEVFSFPLEDMGFSGNPEKAIEEEDPFASLDDDNLFGDLEPAPEVEVKSVPKETSKAQNSAPSANTENTSAKAAPLPPRPAGRNSKPQASVNRADAAPPVKKAPSVPTLPERPKLPPRPTKK